MTQPEKTARRPVPRWMQITLGLSLALNLAVAGLAAGSVLRSGGGDGMRPPSRNLIGSLLHEMPKADRRELRELMRSRTDRTDAHRDEVTGMVAALRAVPFHAATVATLIEGHSDQRAAFQAAMMQGWLDRVTAMSDSDRAAYATRLQEAAERPKKHRRHD
jgi:uncharacterized membrane protein